MNPGSQSDYALDFLNAQGPIDGDGTSPDSNLFVSGQSSSDGTDTEDPVSRGQSSTSKLDMFVQDRPPRRYPLLKHGGFPSGAVPNQTPGAHRIP